jgi:hypothetical protein
VITTFLRQRPFLALKLKGGVDRIVDGEERWHTVGSVGGITLILVVHTSEEEHGEEQIRIISARKANPRERAFYDSNH